MKTRPPLSFDAYWHCIGTDRMLEVLDAAGVELKYARQIKTGLKTPGRSTALLLLDAARKLTPGYVPDLELMLRGVPRDKAKPRKIAPSAAFLAAARRRR